MNNWLDEENILAFILASKTSGQTITAVGTDTCTTHWAAYYFTAQGVL